MKQGFTSLEQLEVRYVDGKGRGVFAIVPILKDKVIEHSPTVKIDPTSYDMLSYTVLYHYFFYDPEDDNASVLGLGYSSIYNHSDKPNARWHVTDGGILIISNRIIKQDEEITISYGWDKKRIKEMREKK